MSAALKIKVCGLRDPQNIREIVALKPDLAGFIFYTGSPRFAGEGAAVRFTLVPPEIPKVAVFVDEHPDRIITLANSYHFGYVQMHGRESYDECRYVKRKGLKVIKAFRIGDSLDLQDLVTYRDPCDYFLLDTKGEGFGGTGRKFEWDLLEQFESPRPLFLSGGIGRDDAGRIKKLKIKNLYAIDINSRFETAPGVKNPSDIRYFMNQLRS